MFFYCAYVVRDFAPHERHLGGQAHRHIVIIVKAYKRLWFLKMYLISLCETCVFLLCLRGKGFCAPLVLVSHLDGNNG